MTERPSLPIHTLEELEKRLGVSAREEADRHGTLESAVIKERQRWLAQGRSGVWFRRKWRELNGIDVATYCRLNGFRPAQVRRAMRDKAAPCIADPFAIKMLVPLWVPLSEGFSHQEIQRATRGEPVHLARLVQAVVESYS